jgi:hypothetical protein
MTVSNLYPARSFASPYGATTSLPCTGDRALVLASAPSQQEGGWILLSGNNEFHWPSLAFEMHSGPVAFAGA